jgi:hypothetical protein
MCEPTDGFHLAAAPRLADNEKLAAGQGLVIGFSDGVHLNLGM